MAAATRRSVRFTARSNPAMYATADDVKAAIGREGVVILDARSDGEWAGNESRSNRRTGRIPGSVHFEWLVNVTDDDVHMMKPPEELRRMYESAGVTPDKEVITLCQGGIRAAQSAATLYLLGFEKVRVYDGSFGEWGNRDDTPLEK
jgi:thiosulfate/3-mercaptopyruvate sulfurtransferase